MRVITRMRITDEAERRLEDLLREHIKKGGKVLNIVYDPFEGYIQHLEGHGIPFRKIKHKDPYSMKYEVLFVLVDENYKHYGGLVGVANTYALLDGETFDEAILKYLRDEYEPIEID